MNQLAKPRLLTLVVSEHSGGGRTGRMLSKVTRRPHEQVPTAELHIISSNSWTRAEKLTRAAALGARPGDALLVMGDDGVAHLGLNTAAGTKATLELISAGTGNDFTRGVGVPRTVDEAVGVIVADWTRTADLVHISDGTLPRRYVSAMVSIGYDARVNRFTNHIRLRPGALSYSYITLWELVSFSPLRCDVIIDRIHHYQGAILVAVSNTGIFRGSIRIAPEADPTDDLLGVTVVSPVSRTTLLKLLPSMYSGTFVKHPYVEQFPARSIKLAGEELLVMGNGEELGEMPVRVECAPGVLKVFVA